MCLINSVASFSVATPVVFVIKNQEPKQSFWKLVVKDITVLVSMKGTVLFFIENKVFSYSIF